MHHRSVEIDGACSAPGRLLRMRLFIARGDPVEFGCRLSHRNARAQPAEDTKEMQVVAHLQRGVEIRNQRSPYLYFSIRKSKAARRHSDDFKVLRIQPDSFAHHIGVAAE